MITFDHVSFKSRAENGVPGRYLLHVIQLSGSRKLRSRLNIFNQFVSFLGEFSEITLCLDTTPEVV